MQVSACWARCLLAVCAQPFTIGAASAANSARCPLPCLASRTDGPLRPTAGRAPPPACHPACQPALGHCPADEAFLDEDDLHPSADCDLLLHCGPPDMTSQQSGCAAAAAAAAVAVAAAAAATGHKRRRAEEGPRAAC
jgi:hypothetical protein